MAAEYSRELGVKVFQGKSRIAKMGFSLGGKPGFGFRRVLLASDGSVKQELKFGEHKYLDTDRVSLILGPSSEVQCVGVMFDLAAQGRKSCADIARYLNDHQMMRDGKTWNCDDVRKVLACPRYAGWSVWNRTTLQLHSRRKRVPPEKWIMRADAIPPIVDQATFDQAQDTLRKHADRSWSDKDIVREMKRLLKAKGRLSAGIIGQTRGVPSPTTIRSRLGSMAKMYELIGYHYDPYDFYQGAHPELALRLRRRIVNRLKKEFNGHVEITHLPGGHRSVLMIDGEFPVSILLCPILYPDKDSQMAWDVAGIAGERDFVTLVCKLTTTRDCVGSSYVFPRIEFKRHRSRKNDPWLAEGRRLRSLTEFYNVVKDVHQNRT